VTRIFAVCTGLVLLSGCVVYSPSPPPPPVVGVPPGHGRVPPGHGGIPPGQAKKRSVVVLAPVRYILIPGTSIYYVEGTQPEVFYVSGNFYAQWESVWHIGPAYEGPWAPLPPNDLPPALKGQTPPGLKRRVPPS